MNILDLLGLGALMEKVNLVILGLKIVVLVFIVGWVRAHIGGGRLGTFLMLLIGYLVLFRYWFLTGPLAILYLLAITGITGLAMDIVFTHGYYNPFAKQPVNPGQEFIQGGERTAEYKNNPAYGAQSQLMQRVKQRLIRRDR